MKQEIKLLYTYYMNGEDNEQRLISQLLLGIQNKHGHTKRPEGAITSH